MTSNDRQPESIRDNGPINGKKKPDRPTKNHDHNKADKNRKYRLHDSAKQLPKTKHNNLKYEVKEKNYSKQNNDSVIRAKMSRSKNEPIIPEGVNIRDLDVNLHNELRTLDKNNARKVAQHLAATQLLLEDNPQAALEHARAAKNRAGRIGSIRQILGIVAYMNGLWAEALSELKAARRIIGCDDIVHLIADCERGLGKPEKAIEFIHSIDISALPAEISIELHIVESGACRDMQKYDKAILALQIPELNLHATGTLASRLSYAYAEALLALQCNKDALVWFNSSLHADPEATDACDRIVQLREKQ